MSCATRKSGAEAMTKSEEAQPTEDGAAPTTRLIAFIDLLGFRSVLGNADATRQQTILTALREVANQERNFEVKVEHRSDRERSITVFPAITCFSDNVLVSYDLSELGHAGGAYLGLMAIRNLACALAHRAREFDCLVRGAVTIGQLYHKDRVAFGSGLVDAYELESRVAFFPRIIVTPSVFETFHAFAAKDGKSSDDRAMFRDTDGYWCLDYMTAYLESLGSEGTPEACTARRAWALGSRAKFLETATALAAAGKTQAAQKWAWFADRFETSMLSVGPHRFDPNGNKLEFP
jgi:hypothetical protein